jgi:uncharacterized coiled-coil protein SlyX
MKKVGIEIEHLQRVNQQQNLLIQVLCDAYNSPNDRGRLFSVIELHARRLAQVASPSGEKRTPQNQIRDGEARVKELERQIREQDSAYQQLEERLRQYNEAARKYEDDLARIGEGNARILASFQRNANGSNSSILSNPPGSPSHHSPRAKELIAQCSKLQKENHDSKELCGQIRTQIAKSQDEFQSIERKLSKAKQRLSDSMSASFDGGSLQVQITEQEKVIESLNQEIDEATVTISQLKRENQSLRDRLQNPDSD